LRVTLGQPQAATLQNETQMNADKNNWKTPFKKTDPRSLLLEYQADLRKQMLEDQVRFLFALWCRQSGKDFSGTEIAVEDCYCNKKTNWSVVAPSERQSLETADKAKEWAAAFKLAIEDYQEHKDSIHPESIIRSTDILFGNGSRFRALPGLPRTVRGISSNMIFTEFNFFEDGEGVWRAAYPSITNPLRGGVKRVLIISTPNGKGNKGYDLWCKTPVGAKEQGLKLYPYKKIRWVGSKVTIYDAIRMGLPLDIDELREGMDDPEGFAQEYNCEFLDGSNVLLPYELIALAESADATEAGADWDALCAKDVYLGIDFGRQNDPTVCWALERVGDVLWTREVMVLQTMDSVAQFEALRSRIIAAKRVCFDFTGPGTGLGDYLAKEYGAWDPTKHQFGKIELCTFTVGFKRDIFPKFRRVFESPTKIRVPISRVVREDLHAMQQVLHNGQYDYWAPRTREGHSDRCTAGALAIRAAGEADTGCGIY
jgi:phage FluMu gp28-like protein